MDQELPDLGGPGLLDMGLLAWLKDDSCRLHYLSNIIAESVNCCTGEIGPGLREFCDVNG